MSETTTHVHARDAHHGEAAPPPTGWRRLLVAGWLRTLWMAPAFGALGLGIVLFIRWIAGWDPLWDMQPIVTVAGLVAFPLGYLAGIGCFDYWAYYFVGGATRAEDHSSLSPASSQSRSVSSRKASSTRSRPT